MSETNPLTQVHDALWQLLEDCTEFTDLVLPGNRIKASSAVRDPEKEAWSAQDFPQVRVLAVALEAHPWLASNTSKLTVGWEIQIATDQQDFTHLYKVAWAVFRATHDWITTLKTLTWNDKVFVLNCLPGEASLGQSEALLVAKIKGWSTVWTGMTEMVFTISDLQGG